VTYIPSQPHFCWCLPSQQEGRKGYDEPFFYKKKNSLVLMVVSFALANSSSFGTFQPSQKARKKGNCIANLGERQNTIFFKGDLEY